MCGKHPKGNLQSMIDLSPFVALRNRLVRTLAINGAIACRRQQRIASGQRVSTGHTTPVRDHRPLTCRPYSIAFTSKGTLFVGNGGASPVQLQVTIKARTTAFENFSNGIGNPAGQRRSVCRRLAHWQATPTGPTRSALGETIRADRGSVQLGFIQPGAPAGDLLNGLARLGRLLSDRRGCIDNR